MKKAIFISIKPQYCTLIESRMKVNEFRSFIPKEEVEYFWIYESSPVSALKYIAKVSKPITYPDQVELVGYGDDRFNSGQSKYKHAYQIESLFRLAPSLPLDFLRDKFSFTAPQGFSYLRTYPELVKYVDDQVSLTQLF